MATLEIHDGKGRVEYLTISRDQQVLFGSDPKCDVVLDDPAASPFHGRLRWRGDRYKVEATPEARALEVDGKKVVSSSFRQGSEIKVGKARIFLITPDDGPADFEKTRVQPRPGSATADAGWGPRMAAMQGREVEPPSIESAFDDVEEVLEEPPPPRKRGRAGRSRRSAAKAGAAAAAPEPASADAPAAPPGSGPLARWVRSVVSGRDQAPGEERVLSSPVVIILALALALLVTFGLGLYGVIREMAADRALAKAKESLENAEFRNAVERFASYVEEYPRHGGASEARVLGGLAGIRQFTTGSNPAWANALASARRTIDEVRDEPAFPDSRADFASAVLDVANGLVDRARRAADAEALSQAEAAVALHDRVGGSAATLARDRARFPGRLEEARAAVLKVRSRREAFAAMDAALADGDPDLTYASRDELVARYPDQADDPEVVDRLRSANELIRAETTVDPTRARGETEPRPDPLGPPTSLVLRSSMEPAGGDGPFAFAVADGFAYAIDPEHGAPIWHVPVGLDCPFPPRPIPGAGGDVLVVDARHDDLVRLRGGDGRLVWRQELGGPVEAPPLVLGNQIAQPTSDGRLLLLDVATGDRQGAIDLGRRLSLTPVADDLGRHYYVLGHSAVAFVIRRDSLECVAVEYVGHDPGAVACPPARVADYLVVAENHRPELGRWSVFQLVEEGTRLRLRQRIGHVGWTWDTPASSDRVIWSVADRGNLAAYAIGPYDQDEPFTLIARTEPEGARLGPTYTIARTDRELWVASARSSRYDLDAERATITSSWTLSRAGAATAPPQVVGDRMILTQQPERGRGVLLWGVDPRRGSVSWQTALGLPWPSPPAPTGDGRALASLSGDGGRLPLSAELLRDGGFVVEPIPRPGDRSLPVGALDCLESGEATLILPSPDADHLLVRVGDSTGLDRVALPSPLASRPLVWGADLLVPGVDGRAYLIDPKTGGPRADPLLPTFTGDGPLSWLDPVAIDGDAVALADRDGTVRRLVKDRGDRPRLVVEAEAVLGSRLVAPPGSTGDTVILATADGRVRALSARDLGPAGAWELDAPLALGPFTDAATGTVLVADAAGEVIAFGPGGERLWTIDFEGDTLSGPPAIAGQDAWLLTLGGTLHRRSLLDGSALDRHELGPLPAGGPSPVGSALVVPVAPGTLRSLSLDAAGPGPER